jgi:uncharacterized membrane protein YfcA
MWHGLIDYWLGMILGATMFVGAVVGARFAIRIGNLWVRRIFLTAVCVLGLNALLLDIFGKNSGCGTPSHATE